MAEIKRIEALWGCNKAGSKAHLTKWGRLDLLRQGYTEEQVRSILKDARDMAEIL